MSATYSEHMAWCKQRALAYVDRGDLTGAIASFASDISKHDAATNTSAVKMTIVMIGLPIASGGNIAEMRRFIEGFAE